MYDYNFQIMENDTNCKTIHHQVVFSEDNIHSDYTYISHIIDDKFYVYTAKNIYSCNPQADRCQQLFILFTLYSNLFLHT